MAFQTRAPRRVVGLVGLTIAGLLFGVAGVSAQSPTPTEKPLPTLVPLPSLPVPTPAATNLGQVTAGINERDPVPYTAAVKLIEYCNVQAGIQVQPNYVDHGTFQNTISQRLTATPEDIIKWFAGERLQFFADQGLLTPIDDVWDSIGANYSDAFKGASKGTDGKYYFVPLLNYPWVVMYRKSLFQEKGYTIPKTIDEFKALGDKMKADGLVPLSFGDKDGWPAMGMFDILNMRLNGYQFHIDLMAGKEKWTDARVKNVFQTWAALLPYFQENATGRTWQDAAKAMLVDKKAGMHFLGTFAAQQANQADIADIGFFPFPLMGTQFDSENAIDAPIDGFMLSKSPKNLEAAKAFLKCVATPEAQKTWVSIDNGNVAAVSNADTSAYNDIQKAGADIIAKSGKIAQFLDRDTRSDFAGASGMQNFLQKFLSNPSQDLDAFLNGIQQYYDSLDPLN
jgi:multiple sugar transport system substrate-binding protein